VVETKEAQATHRDQVRGALLRDLEAARYAADRAFQQYDAADPANRHVAAEMEARWNQPLECVGEVDAKIAAHDAATPPVLEPTQASLMMLAGDLRRMGWKAPTTDARLKKRIVRTRIREVVADIDAGAAEIVLIIHLMGGAHRTALASAPTWPAQEHLTRHREGCPETRLHRERRSHRWYPQSE
jgi:hypothetical protein